MPGNSSLKRDFLLEQLADSLLARAGCRGLVGRVEVYWNGRMRSTAGIACYSKRRIVLNPQLAGISGREVGRTLRHELAHFVAQFRAGRRRIAPHGEEWQTACRDLGIPGEARCHTLPLRTKRIPRKHFYRCRQCGASLARVRPPKRPIACIKCCRTYNNGKYDERFRFIPVATPRTRAA